jgi:hypothetical protein
MNRREFIGFAAFALGAAVVAPKLLLPEPVYPTSGNVTCTLEWTPCRSYKVGDVVTVSGFSNREYNGKWVVVKDSTFARVA